MRTLCASRPTVARRLQAGAARSRRAANELRVAATALTRTARAAERSVGQPRLAEVVLAEVRRALRVEVARLPLGEEACIGGAHRRALLVPRTAVRAAAARRVRAEARFAPVGELVAVAVSPRRFTQAGARTCGAAAGPHVVRRADL